jgi:lipoprotein-anchoring transpeptidase ErfK/SrfK
MRRPFLIVSAVAVLVLGGLAVAVAIFDAKSKDKIADGVKIGTVDVGGMTPEEARVAVRDALVAPLDKPVKVKYDGQTWKLSAEKAQIKADVDSWVDDAVARSKSGNVFQHAWREATGGKVDATIAADVTYDEGAVKDFVAKIKETVDTEPVDATLEYSDTSLTGTEGKDGTVLRANKLLRKIGRNITTPGGKRTFNAKVADVEPKVTTADLAEQYPVVLTVDREAFKLRLFKGLKLVKTYDVRVGQQGLETPAGLYHIQNKAVDPAWNVPYSDWTGDLAGTVVPGGTPENPLKARWMGIFDGAGIHGIDPSAYGTIGTAASHGCVGMRIPDVEELYDQVQVGAPIYID